MIKNIIFDWSGTLSNDMVPGYTTAMEVFKKLGLKQITIEQFRQEFTLPYMNFYKKFKPDIKKEDVDSIYSEIFSSIEEPKPFPKAREILEFLKEKGIRIAILSSHPQGNLEKEVDKYGFRSFFIDINGGVHDKTDEVLEIMKRNAFEPDETAYVGDMEHDIDAGRKTGVVTIAVTWGYQPAEVLSKKSPDFLIYDLDELKAIIE
jgi:phosphoglycolate phosphatase